jgi:hypothetical protein
MSVVLQSEATTQGWSEEQKMVVVVALPERLTKLRIAPWRKSSYVIQDRRRTEGELISSIARAGARRKS